MKRRDRINYDNVFTINPHEMSMPDLKKYVEREVRKANKRLLRIERAGNYSYAYNRAMRELDAMGRRRFSYAGKTRGELVKKLYFVEAFLTHETSKVRELRKIQERAFETLSREVEKRLKINPKDIGLNRNEFYKFLNSKQMKDLIADNDYTSGQVIDEIVSAMKAHPDFSLNQVLDAYKDFVGTHLPLDAVEYRRLGKIGSYEEYAEMLRRKKQR